MLVVLALAGLAQGLPAARTRGEQANQAGRVGNRSQGAGAGDRARAEVGGVRAEGGPVLPPGPRGGRLRNCYRRLSGYAEFMEQLHEEYGDIVFFELPRLKCCAVFDAGLAQEVLVAQAPFFAPWALGGREPNKLMEHGCLPVHHGEEHRWRRELMQTAFAEDRLHAYAEVIGEHALKLRARLQPGRVIDSPTGGGALYLGCAGEGHSGT